MNKSPDLKTLEEFCAFYEKDTPENKAWLFHQHQFAMKERVRLREKDKRARHKKAEEKKALNIPRKKPGPKGPWKHKVNISTPPTENPGFPGPVDNLPK